MKKQMKKILAVMLTTVVMLTAVVPAIAVQAKNSAKCEHEYFFEYFAKPSTTKEKGLMIEACLRCGQQRKRTLDKLGGKYTPYKRVTVKGNTYEVYEENTWSIAADVAVLVKAKNASAVTIPDSIKYRGMEYLVTGIASKAFYNNKKIKKVTIGKEVTSISSKAFYKCPNLKNIIIKSDKLTYTMNKKVYYMAGKSSFKGINKKAVIKVPKKVKKTYKNVFKGMKVK